MKELQDLIEISKYYGANKNYTLAGGGNTSFKNDEFIWIKASGATLATIDEAGFAQLYRSKVQVVGEKKYSDDEQLREVEVKEDLIAANAFPKLGKRPSVETSFHEAIKYAFVVHMHPTITNSLMCGKNSKEETLRLFGEEAVYIPFAPGYPLFMKVKEALSVHRKKFDTDPNLIFLENHGIFVSADNINEIKNLYSYVTKKIERDIPHLEAFEELEIPKDVSEFLPHIRKALSEDISKSTIIKHSTLHKHFYNSETDFEKIDLPFTPDIIVYCKSAYLYIEDSSSPQAIIDSFNTRLPKFISNYGYQPKLILVKGYGLIAVEDNAQSAEIAMEVYEDLMKVSFYSEAFGGPRFMSKEEIAFIDNWEVENYRRKISKDQSVDSDEGQCIIIVNGDHRIL
jgi:rhamnose utilization protein RhaD (predicted bifunctional aldolase and dehydrogenase)